MHISHKAFNIARAGGAAALLAFTGWVVQAPVWLVALVTAGVAAATVGATLLVVHRVEMFAELTVAAREQIVRWIAVAAVAHVAWVAGVELRPDLVLWWAGGLLMLAGAEYQTARALEYLWTRPVRTDAVQVRATRAREQHIAESDEATQVLRKALDLVSLHWLQILGAPSPIGSAGAKFEVQIPARNGKDAKGAARKLSPEHAEDLAIALSEVTDVPLMSDWVSITKLPHAGRYSISVVTEDVMRRVIPYTEQWDADGCVLPCPVTEPMVNGYQIDGAPILLRIDQHGQVVGRSGSGKSDALKRKIAHALRGGAEVWVCGTRKLYDLLAEWLEPYVGTGRKTPFDAVAYGQTDLLEMYAGALRLGQYRQNVPLAKRRAWRRIIIVTDEASFPLENTKQKKFYDGREQTAAQLGTEGVKATKSAGIYWWWSGQRGTNDQLGDQGGTLKTNIGFTEVFKSKDPAELGRCLGDEYYKLPKPRHSGQSWLDQGDGLPEDEASGMPVFGKGAYIQEDDPSKARLHDGLTTAAISWARRDLVLDEPLDERERAVLGDWYVNRRRTAEQLIEYLTGELPEPVNTVENAGYEAAWAELEALGIPRSGVRELTASSSAATPEPAVPVGAGPVPPVTRKDRIVHLVSAQRQVTTAEILAAVRTQEGSPPEKSVLNTLRELVDEGRLVRPEKGVYVPADPGHVTSCHVT